MSTANPRTAAFSLAEMLVAMAVLSLMLVFMFNLVSQAISSWERGAKQVEGSLVARIGLDRMAADLKYAMAGGGFVSAPMPGGQAGLPQTNVLPFYAKENVTSLPGESGNLAAAPESDVVFAVAPVAEEEATNGPFAEVGFLAAYVAKADGHATLAGQRYYLLRHSPFKEGKDNVTEPVNNFFFRSSNAVSTNWFAEGAQTTNRLALVDDCYQMQLQYATNNQQGKLVFTESWTNQTSLPAGVLVTLKIMDAKTAARIRQMRPQGLTTADVQPGANSDVARVLRAGTKEISRFIPFLNSTN